MLRGKEFRFVLIECVDLFRETKTFSKSNKHVFSKNQILVAKYLSTLSFAFGVAYSAPVHHVKHVKHIHIHPEPSIKVIHEPIKVVHAPVEHGWNQEW